MSLASKNNPHDLAQYPVQSLICLKCSLTSGHPVLSSAAALKQRRRRVCYAAERERKRCWQLCPVVFAKILVSENAELRFTVLQVFTLSFFLQRQLSKCDVVAYLLNVVCFWSSFCHSTHISLHAYKTSLCIVDGHPIVLSPTAALKARSRRLRCRSERVDFPVHD